MEPPPSCRKLSLLIISEPAELQALADSRSLYSKQPLAVRLRGLTPEEALTLSERLNRDRSECGCSLGARCMTAAFATTTAWLAIRHGLFTLALLWRLPIPMAAALLFAGIGKAAGIALARRRLRREIASLLTSASSQPEGMERCLAHGPN